MVDMKKTYDNFLNSLNTIILISVLGYILPLQDVVEEQKFGLFLGGSGEMVEIFISNFCLHFFKLPLKNPNVSGFDMILHIFVYACIVTFLGFLCLKCLGILF